jgi:hypothetical protein
MQKSKFLIDIIDTTNEINIIEEMEKKKLEIGSKLYWVDAPELLAGVVVRFTPKRDVVINFLSGSSIR